MTYQKVILTKKQASTIYLRSEREILESENLCYRTKIISIPTIIF